VAFASKPALARDLVNASSPGVTKLPIRRSLTNGELSPAAFQLHWSQRQHHHQAVARDCHYKHRTEQLE
jgi:hypothetical protein